jgi:glycosyltransferase involved in cell wall biosynthesis
LIPKVSIIIPVYNREHLIGETLDSILTQTYTNWECILVDDHSTDATIAVLEAYRLKDKRIKWVSRPNDRFKGANACRNYGFELSKGEVVLFYDSDDLMLPHKLQVSVETLGKCDFVVSRSLNFENSRFMEIPNYPPPDYTFNLPDFFAARVFWITDDVLIKRQAIKKITFDETLQSGQEYNFFCCMLMHTVKGISLPQVTSHRRLHAKSIQSSQAKQESILHSNRYCTYRKTLMMAFHVLDKPEKRFLVRRITKHILGLIRLGIQPPELKNLLNLLKGSLTGFELLIFRSACQFVKFTRCGDTFFAKYIEKRMRP